MKRSVSILIALAGGVAAGWIASWTTIQKSQSCQPAEANTIMRLFGMVVALSGVSLLTGCATLNAHNQLYGPPGDSHQPSPLEKHCPPIFKGFYYDTTSIGLGLISPIYPTDDAPRYSILLTPCTALDLPLSLVADIFYLPSDVHNWRHPDVRNMTPREKRETHPKTTGAITVPDDNKAPFPDKLEQKRPAETNR